MGSVVKVGDMYEKTREGISRWMMKEVVGCVQYVVGDNNVDI